MASTSVTLHALQVAREINTFDDYKVAKFFHGDTYDQKYLLCTAWFQKPDIRKIQCFGYFMDIEKASAVSIAVQMAVEWLAEQT